MSDNTVSISNQKPRDLDRDIRLAGRTGALSKRRTDSLVIDYRQLPARRRIVGRSMNANSDEGIPESVFAPDNRQQIIDTTGFPYSAICSLEILNSNDQKFFGTGFLAGPQLVVTAGHNVFFHGEGFMKSITVYPGLNGNRFQPIFRSATSRNFRSVEAWVSSIPNRQFDIGAIILPTKLGEDAGWFSISNFTDNTLTGLSVNVCGYPLHPPSTHVPRDASTAWIDSGRFSQVFHNQLRYTIDTSVSQSGSPVFAYFPDLDDPYQAVGVHNTTYTQSNAATRFNDSIFETIIEWLDESNG